MAQPISQLMTRNPFRDKDVYDAAGRKIRGKEVFLAVEDTPAGKRLIYLNEEDLSTHTLLLGTTGVGKTVLMSNVVCQFIRNGWPIFSFDFKGDEDLLKAAYLTACHCGREKDFIIFNPTAMRNESGWMSELGTCSYNPSVSIKSPEDLTIAELRASSGKVANSVDFWAKVQEGYIRNLNYAMHGTGKAFSARDKYIALLRPDAMQTLIDETRNYESRVYWENILMNWQRKPDIYEQNVSGTRMFYEKMGTGSYAKMLNTYTPDLSVVEAYSTNKIVWNLLPSMAMGGDARTLAKLQLSEILTLAGQVQSTSQIKRPCLVLIDEARHAIFEAFADALAQGRSAGFWIFMGLQSIKQIDQESSVDYRKELQTNLRSVIVMSTGNDEESADEFSKMWGEKAETHNHRAGDMTMSETSTRNVSATDIMGLRNYEMKCRTPRGEFAGHIVSLFNPRQFELGVDCPKPRFIPSVDMENGLRLFERIVPQGV